MLTSTETEGRRSQIFYRMREFMGSREAILRVWLGAVGHGLLREKAAKFQSTRAKGSDTSAHERVAATSRGALRRQVGLPTEASAEARAFMRSRRGVCRDSRFWSLHLQSARPGANTEDKVRCSHLTPCHTAGSRPAHA